MRGREGGRESTFSIQFRILCTDFPGISLVNTRTYYGCNNVHSLI